MRLFVGIPLADVVVHELAAAASRLRAQERRALAGAGGLRWTEPESWHITLQFLGNASQEQFDCLTARLREVRSTSVEVRLGELGFFDRAGVFFADVTVTPALAGLQQRVIAATGECGFVAEARSFHPHITLAREKGHRNEGTRDGGNAAPGSVAGEKGSDREKTLRRLLAETGRQPAFTRFDAREFLLYESHLGQQGARYEVRARFGLVRS